MNHKFIDSSARQNSTIPYDFSLQTLNEEKISFSKFKGKTIFINLWATWCGPCIEEMPDIQSLYEKVKSERIEFVMISLDDGKGRPKKFVERKKYTFPVYQLVEEAPDFLGTSSIPTTFVISPEGKVVMRHEGKSNYNNEKFIDFLKKF